MTVIYPPQNFIPEDTFSDMFWMHRIQTPIWRHCYKGHHDSPFHIEAEGAIGSMQPAEVLWACSTCGYRYPVASTPEPFSDEWHQERLTLALDAAVDEMETVTATLPADYPSLGGWEREQSASALRYLAAMRDLREREEDEG